MSSSPTCFPRSPTDLYGCCRHLRDKQMTERHICDREERNPTRFYKRFTKTQAAFGQSLISYKTMQCPTQRVYHTVFLHSVFTVNHHHSKLLLQNLVVVVSEFKQPFYEQRGTCQACRTSRLLNIYKMNTDRHLICFPLPFLHTPWANTSAS